jgi:hypothetical protein
VLAGAGLNGCFGAGVTAFTGLLIGVIGFFGGAGWGFFFTLLVCFFTTGMAYSFR